MFEVTSITTVFKKNKAGINDEKWERPPEPPPPLQEPDPLEQPGPSKESAEINWCPVNYDEIFLVDLQNDFLKPEERRLLEKMLLEIFKPKKKESPKRLVPPLKLRLPTQEKKIQITASTSSEKGSSSIVRNDPKGIAANSSSEKTSSLIVRKKLKLDEEIPKKRHHQTDQLGTGKKIKTASSGVVGQKSQQSGQSSKPAIGITKKPSSLIVPIGPNSVRKVKPVVSGTSDRNESNSTNNTSATTTTSGISANRAAELRSIARRIAQQIPDAAKIKYQGFYKKLQRHGFNLHKTKSSGIKKKHNKKKQLRQIEQPKKDLFVRQSILDKTPLVSQISPLSACFGLGPRAAAVSMRRPSNYADKELRVHPFVTKLGKVKVNLRPAGAMDVQLQHYGSRVLPLFNNLTAKVTKAIRQNGGFKAFNNYPPNANNDDEAPRFAARKPYRLFRVPGRFADGRAILQEGQKWQANERERLHKRTLATLFDIEMCALDVGRTLSDDILISTKNCLHLYLFGINSPYGDTANLESDLRMGRLTPAPVWIKKKPYVEMVINGLQSRGKPHITFVPPVNNQQENGSESGVDNGAANGPPQPAMITMGIQRQSSSDTTLESTDSPASTSQVGVSPFAMFPTPSPTLDEFGRPITGNFTPLLRRPPLPASQAAGTSSGYEDYSTRIW